MLSSDYSPRIIEQRFQNLCLRRWQPSESDRQFLFHPRGAGGKGYADDCIAGT